MEAPAGDEDELRHGVRGNQCPSLYIQAWVGAYLGKHVLLHTCTLLFIWGKNKMLLFLEFKLKLGFCACHANLEAYPRCLRCKSRVLWSKNAFKASLLAGSDTFLTRIQSGKSIVDSLVIQFQTPPRKKSFASSGFWQFTTCKDSFSGFTKSLFIYYNLYFWSHNMYVFPVVLGLSPSTTPPPPSDNIFHFHSCLFICLFIFYFWTSADPSKITPLPTVPVTTDILKDVT